MQEIKLNDFLNEYMPRIRNEPKLETKEEILYYLRNVFPGPDKLGVGNYVQWNIVLNIYCTDFEHLFKEYFISSDSEETIKDYPKQHIVVVYKNGVILGFIVTLKPFEQETMILRANEGWSKLIITKW